MIIAIDGPAGAGKSTVAKVIAQKLGFLYIDTGAMYRALTLKILNAEVPVTDISRITSIAKNTTINLYDNPDGTLRVVLDGGDVSKEIREPKVTQYVSDIAKIKEVREIMVALQRHMGEAGDVVLDGRDIGTVVFPLAKRKFYIDANVKERARRRHKELVEAGQEVTIEDIEKDVVNRDTIDSSREVGPLKRAPDAMYIDTTNMTIDEVVDVMLSRIL